MNHIDVKPVLRVIINWVEMHHCWDEMHYLFSCWQKSAFLQWCNLYFVPCKKTGVIMIAQIGWVETGPNCHIQSHLSALSNSDNQDDNIGIRQLVRTPNNTPSLVSRSSGLRWRVAHLLPSNLSIAKIHESCADLSMRLRFSGAWGTQTLFRSVEILLPVSRHGVSSFSLALPQAVDVLSEILGIICTNPFGLLFWPWNIEYLICRFKSNCIIWSCQHRKLNRWLEVSEVWGWPYLNLRDYHHQ